MVAFLEDLLFWHWWILAIAMVILETLAPGVIFLWLGVGAAATGAIVLAAPSIDWQLQLGLFAGLTVVSGFGGRAWLKRNPQESDNPLLNQRSAQYVGNTYTLDEPIINGVGKIRVGDSNWIISGEDMPSGTKVKVTGTKAASLIVEKAGD